jgi:hypothetical protein
MAALLTLTSALVCSKCVHQSAEVQVVESGPQKKAVCAKCCGYLKFLGKSEQVAA